jgi:hypothetical protein
VDKAVQLCYERDVIADLILNGPDTEKGRSNLTPLKNKGDFTPWIKYIAARYGSYPNVWICLSNEYDIRNPSYLPEQIVRIGTTMKNYLPYPTPLSIHANNGNWNNNLNNNWCDHIIIQNKIKNLNRAAEYNQLNHYIGGGKPVINDELAYEGSGDGWTEEDVTEAMLGAFIGGGYGSTGYKSGNKIGHYLAGNFNAEEHASSDNLTYLREVLDARISFWKMAPDVFTSISYKEQFGSGASSIFHNIDPAFCSMQWPGHEYLLATNKKKDKIIIHLPEGEFSISSFDFIGKKEQILALRAKEKITISSPESRAGLILVKRTE